jgi:cell division transport system permease protein
MEGRFSLLYMLGDAMRSLRANLLTALLSSVTVGFALAILAIFAVVIINLNGVVEIWGDRTHIVAYVKRGAEREDPGILRGTLTGLPGVKSAEYVSGARAFELLKEELEGQGGILEGIGSNSLPASFEIRMDGSHMTPEGVREAVEAVRALGWVEDVQYGADWVERFSSLLGFLEISALVVGVFLAAATLFIISNTIRLTVYARREEIEIMRYLGADDIFIKVPFFVEGMVEGFTGGLLALAMLLGGRYALEGSIPPYLGFVVDPPVEAAVFLVVLVAAGVSMGAVGSLVSLGRFLKV